MVILDIDKWLNMLVCEKRPLSSVAEFPMKLMLYPEGRGLSPLKWGGLPPLKESAQLVECLLHPQHPIKNQHCMCICDSQTWRGRPADGWAHCPHSLDKLMSSGFSEGTLPQKDKAKGLEDGSQSRVHTTVSDALSSAPNIHVRKYH